MNMKRVVAVVALSLAVLWGLGTLVSKFSQGGAPSVTASHENQPTPPEKWQVKEDVSPMDGSKTVVLSLDSEDVIQGPIGPKTPSLIIRCKESKTEVYVVTGMAASVEEGFDGGPADDHTVRIRLDQGNPLTEHWGESTSHNALFAGDGAGLAKALASAKTMTFQFTPFDANPAVARFDLQGLDTHLNKVAEACHWHVDEMGRRY